MLRLISSNSIEDLATALASELSRHKPADPLTPQRVLISTNAMSRWLALALSERIGICAGIEFDFAGRHLRQLILELDGAFLAGQRIPGIQASCAGSWPNASPPSRDHALGTAAAAVAARHWHQGNGLDAQRLHLILQLSDTLDQYGLYRPQMVRRWLKGRASMADARSQVIGSGNQPCCGNWRNAWNPAGCPTLPNDCSMRCSSHSTAASTANRCMFLAYRACRQPSGNFWRNGPALQELL